MALAGDILSRLPHFCGATLAEIIDIRRELEKPLKRFRRAMLDYSDRISCAPWEEAFNAETDRVFIREIEPAVLELDDAVARHRIDAVVGVTSTYSVTSMNADRSLTRASDPVNPGL